MSSSGWDRESRGKAGRAGHHRDVWEVVHDFGNVLHLRVEGVCPDVPDAARVPLADAIGSKKGTFEELGNVRVFLVS